MTDQRFSKNRAELVNLVNERLSENPVWKTLLVALSRVIDERVNQPQSQLASLRDPRMFRRGDWADMPGEDGEYRRAIINGIAIGGGPGGSDLISYQLPGSQTTQQIAISTSIKQREIQIQGCRVYGFSYFSDALSDQDYVRIHEWIEHFWPESGTRSFVDFMGFVKNMRLSIDQLWSDEVTEDDPVSEDGDRDYYPYLEVDPITLPIEDGGKAYPTSHVHLNYNPLITPQADTLDLFLMFYFLAPIHLVLHRIVALLEAEVPIKEGVVPAVTLMTSGVVDPGIVARLGAVAPATHALSLATSGTLIIESAPALAV